MTGARGGGVPDCKTRKRGLVVEDDPDVAAVLKEILTSVGFHVRCVGSGRAAIATLEAHKTELAIVDLLLSDGLTGKAVASCAAGLGVPAIVISGALNIQEAVANLPHRWLRKPFRVERLLAEVAAALNEPARTCPLEPV